MARARQPRAYLVANGVTLPILEATATLNTYATSNTISATMPLWNMPEGMGNDFWLYSYPIDIAFVAGEMIGSLSTILKGSVIKATPELNTGILKIEARDPVQDMIEAITNEKFQNQTVLQIVETIAKRHGLTVKSDGDSADAGKKYHIDFAKLTDQKSEAALLQYLADQQGKIWYVSGSNLIFIDADSDAGKLYQFNFQRPSSFGAAAADFISCRLELNARLKRTVIVQVKSINSALETIVTGTAKKNGHDHTSSPLIYNYRKPNLTQAQADAMAQKKLLEVTRHHLSMTMMIPGNPLIEAGGRVQILGADVDDTVFALDSVTHSISTNGGYTTTLHGKSPNARNE